MTRRAILPGPNVRGGLRGAVGLALALVVSEESDLYADENVGPVVLLCTGIVVGPGRCIHCPPRHQLLPATSSTHF